MPLHLKRRIRKHRRIDIPCPHGVSDVTRLGSLTLLISTTASDPSQNDLCDSSGPLFSLYSKTVEESDLNRAERHSKDAEGIVLFVSPSSCLSTPKHVD